MSSHLDSIQCKFADLHLHTIFSDGTYTPQELIQKSAEAGLYAVAVTDHDTVSGIAPAIEAAAALAVEVLPGIELTSEYDGREIHILGYLIDYTRNELKESLGYLKQARKMRIYKITAKLREVFGINLTPESVFDIVREGTPGRLHIARALVAKGFVDSTYEAFKKYIGDKSPAYVSGFKLSPQEAIKLIRDSKGVPVLAHPYSVAKDELISMLVGFGLMGLEVYYPEHTQSMINFYTGLAKKFNLVLTGGSDCHGDAKAEIKLGSVKIPYELVEKIKEAKKRELING